MLKLNLSERWSLAFAALAALMALYMLIHYFGFVEDDAFITLRYAQNWLRGDGIVFNPGERVEGYTSFLMVLLTAFTGFLGFDMVIAQRVISLSGYFITLIALCVYLHYFFYQRSDKWTLIVTALTLIATSYPFILWALSGLETAIFTGLNFIAVSCALYFLENKQVNKKILLSAAFFFALAGYTRPEAPIFAVMCFGFCCLQTIVQKNISDKRFREIIIAVALWFVLSAAYYVWRYSYYGEWLPNTYYAKLTDLPVEMNLHSGIAYVWEYLKAPPYIGFYFLLLAPFAFVSRKYPWGNACLFTIIFTFTAYVIYAGGDWMGESRFLVPVLPLVAVFCVRVFSEHVNLKELKAQILVMSVVIFFSIVQFAYYIPMSVKYGLQSWRSMASYINENWPKGSLIGINMAGLIPYMTPDYYYLDLLGLNDKHIARVKVVENMELYKQQNIQLNRMALGHRKGDGIYVINRRPDYLILGGGVEAIPLGAYISDQQIIHHPDFTKFYVQRREPLEYIVRGHSEDLTFVYYELKPEYRLPREHKLPAELPPEGK